MKKSILLLSFLLIKPINSQETLPREFRVSFHAGMTSSQWYRPIWVQQNTIWQQVKRFYDSYIIQCSEKDLQLRIPKIIHQIWIGGSLPEKYRDWQQSWKKHHPDWEYMLWTDKDIEEFGLTNKYWYDKTPNLAQKADIARYEILYRIGGVYVDTDFECLKPLDVLHHSCDFYVGIFQWWRFRLLNALIGSAPGHPILKECIDSMNLDVKHHPNPRLNVTYTTGPEHLTRCFIQKANESGRCVAFPSNHFYPWPWYRKQDKHNLWIKSESFAIHHSAESWFNQPLLRSLLAQQA